MADRTRVLLKCNFELTFLSPRYTENKKMHVASHISFSSKLLMKLQFELTLGTDFYLIWPAVRVPHHGRTASKKYITLHVRGLFCMADPGQSRSKASESGLECYLLKLQMLKMPRAWRPKVWLFIDWQLAKGSRKLALSPLCFSDQNQE